MTRKEDCPHEREYFYQRAIWHESQHFDASRAGRECVNKNERQTRAVLVEVDGDVELVSPLDEWTSDAERAAHGLRGDAARRALAMIEQEEQ